MAKIRDGLGMETYQAEQLDTLLNKSPNHKKMGNWGD